MKFLFLFFILLSSKLTFSQIPSISGRVTSEDTKEYLPGAIVSIAGSSIHTTTDSTGSFKFSSIAPGDYNLSIEYVGFNTYSKKITLHAGQEFHIDIQLKRKANELEYVTVFGHVNGEKESSSRTSERKSNNIENVISARSMERSPDINAANVLQRMSGVTIQRNSGADEAYAIVRGLEARYSNTLINGVKIASPDEKSRFVSLDIIPSDLLQKIEVSKSLTPEMEADAVGGTVNMVMKDAPDSFLFKATGSLGYSGIFFDRKYNSFSKKDIQQKSLYDRFGSTYIAQPDDFSRSNLDFKDIQPYPTGTLGLAVGKRFFNQKMGFLVADNFQNQYYGTNSIYNQAVPDIYKNVPSIANVGNRTISTQRLNNGLTLHLDYNFNDRNKISLTNVFIYSHLVQSRNIIDTAIKGGNGGRTVPGTGPITYDYLSITEHQYIENLKLEGKHILSKHFLMDWAGVFSSATKRTPDRADLNLNSKIDTVHTGDGLNTPYTFVQTPNYFDEITRIWQHNKDQDLDGLANLTYRSELGKGATELKLGGFYRHKTRFNLQNEYILKPTANSNGVKQQFNHIYSAEWVVYDTKGTQDYDINNYKLYENIGAGYGQAKFVFRNFDLVGGVRVETTEQGFTLNTFYPTGINGVKKEYTDVLPSVMLKWKLNPKTNLRFSYFKSISRPNYYELVPATLLNNSTPTAEVGNPNLNHSVAENFDLRYELYPKEEEQFFVGAFYKKIKDPIEYVYVDISTYTPQNLGTATVYGAELVYTKYFGDFGLSGNYTYIYSEISSPKFYTDVIAQTTDPHRLQKRPMQGQADNSLNLSLLFRDERRAFFAQLAYQFIGKTLARVYPVYGYDYYSQPQSFLAIALEKGLGNRHFTAFGKFSNILNTASTFKINNLLVEQNTYNFNFNIGLRYSR